ncbi:DUF924 family protein [Oleiagrimonas sp. C23AA]|uniref:DUF924 family protein n=1 Tax=Oleiagrimonas sp. C23AA TaxID=2719047 RepID=UPI0014245F7F|nr:DUF924 family protein [Oleiagrimonas sp. C23AA]NII11929.1 DUF924 domain-containing protein [Oleiagrimonas sp. C23AA]
MSSVIPQQVLGFWFGEGKAAGQPRQAWFQKDADFDAQIRQRFGNTVQTALGGGLVEWTQTPSGWLALIVVLDQFTRNIGRDTEAAFAGDARALTLALEGIARGDDQALSPLERVFCYLPLEHAEDAMLQARSVGLFEALRDAVPAASRAPFENFLDYARRHQQVIERFGRFPHRNGLLGRTSTPAEVDYLSQPGAGF